MGASFVDVKGFEEYAISESGVVILKETGKVLTTRTAKNSRVIVSIRNKNTTGHVHMSVFVLLAVTFLDFDISTCKKYVCVPKDRDQGNTVLNNTEVVSQEAYQKECATLKRNELLEVLGWSDSDVLTESPKKGFYWIPFIKFPVAINENGQLFNFMKNHLMKLRKNHKGYLQVSLWTDEIGKYASYAVHRLVGRVFIEVPSRYVGFDISELQINHMDGWKENNHKGNLEWCLNHENNSHARETGLFSNDVPVLAKDIRTGNVKRFRSISECARVFGIGNSPLSISLSSPRSAGRITFNWHVFKFDDSHPWPVTLMESYDRDGFKWLCNVVVLRVIDGERIIFSNYRHACRALGFKLSTVRWWLATHGYNRPYKGYVFSTFTDDMQVD